MIASWQIMLVLRMPIAFKFSAVLGPKAPDGHPCSPPEEGRISSFGILCEAAKTIQSAVEVMASSVTSALHSVGPCSVFCPGTQRHAHRPLREAQLARIAVAEHMHGGGGMPYFSDSVLLLCIHTRRLVHSATRHKIHHTHQSRAFPFDSWLVVAGWGKVSRSGGLNADFGFHLQNL